jgi:hypothetical protein
MTYSGTGKVSYFGGPEDTGVGPEEGLALCDPKDVGKFASLFLAEQPSGTTGLARRLDSQKAYIAMRWDYTKTPRSYLQGIEVMVHAPKTGLEFPARPIDWGPAEGTGRLADISKGLMDSLGIETDDEVTVTVSLPSEEQLKLPEPSAHAPSVGHLHAMPQSPAAFDAVYGKLTYTEGGPDKGDILLSSEWIKENIVEADVPQLHKWTRGKPIQCHRLVAPHLIASFADIEKAGKSSLILSYDGMWVPRHKDHDPRRGISLHSYGGAIDINAEWNPYGHVPAPAGAKGSCVELIPFFEAHGFSWGGYFGGGHASDTDGMHFEWTGTGPVEISVTKGADGVWRYVEGLTTVTDAPSVAPSPAPSAAPAPAHVDALQQVIQEAVAEQLAAMGIRAQTPVLAPALPPALVPAQGINLGTIGNDINAVLNILVPFLSITALFPVPYGPIAAAAILVVQEIQAAMNNIPAAGPQAIQATAQAHRDNIPQLWAELQTHLQVLFSGAKG